MFRGFTLRRRARLPVIRGEAFLGLAPTDRPVLEIGPFNSPRLTGEHVRYFDIADQAALNRRALKKGLSPSAPHIHFVSPTGDLSVVQGRYATLLAAHSIEHQRDLVSHLRQAAALLEPGGRYHLIIPDKRYCFDHFLAESTIAEVLDAHLRPTPAHTPRSVIEHRVLTTHNQAKRHWRGDHGRPREVTARLRRVLAEIQQGAGGEPDVHAFRFTPESFGDVIRLLFELELVGLRPAQIYDTPRNRFEFCAILEKPFSAPASKSAPGGE